MNLNVIHDNASHACTFAELVTLNQPPHFKTLRTTAIDMRKLKAAAVFVSMIDAAYFVVKTEDGQFYSFVTAELLREEEGERMYEILCVHSFDTLDGAVLCALSQLAIDRDVRENPDYEHNRDLLPLADY